MQASWLKTLLFRCCLKKRTGEYKIPSGCEVFTCGTSDFFLDEADEWRKDAWAYIRERQDLTFLIITKRIHRFEANLPKNWENGYPNVRIGCTVENQKWRISGCPSFCRCPYNAASLSASLCSKQSIYSPIYPVRWSLSWQAGNPAKPQESVILTGLKAYVISA